jgi:hypothetical protein
VFTELIKEPGGSLLGGPFAPNYIGYEMVVGAGRAAALAFAGTFSELVVVRSGPLLLIERVEHEWWAVQILPQ